MYCEADLWDQINTTQRGEREIFKRNLLQGIMKRRPLYLTSLKTGKSGTEKRKTAIPAGKKGEGIVRRTI